MVRQAQFFPELGCEPMSIRGFSQFSYGLPERRCHSRNTLEKDLDRLIGFRAGPGAGDPVSCGMATTFSRGP
jgi:hypothetical protein